MKTQIELFLNTFKNNIDLLSESFYNKIIKKQNITLEDFIYDPIIQKCILKDLSLKINAFDCNDFLNKQLFDLDVFEFAVKFLSIFDEFKSLINYISYKVETFFSKKNEINDFFKKNQELITNYCKKNNYDYYLFYLKIESVNFNEIEFGFVNKIFN